MSATADLFARTLPAPPTFPDIDVVTEGDGAAWAVFSTDRRYRYLLGRAWDELRSVMVFGMLNPSVAGAIVDDPTLRKCVGFARRNYCGGIIVCNVGAFITPDVREFAKADDPIGPHNERMIAWACRAPLMAIGVAAWGRLPSKRVYERCKASMVWMQQLRMRWCLGKTQDGEPRHPLMLAYSTPLVSLADGRPFP